MDKKKGFIEKWKSDYDFKTMTVSSVSLAVTLVFALYNGFLGIRHSSLWYGSICIYYLILMGIRGLLILSEKRLSRRGDSGPAVRRVYIAAALCLLFLNISLIVPVSMMVRLQKPVNMTLIPAIAMAANTTYRIVLASVNLRRRKRSSDSLLRLLRIIDFIDALVSVLLLQNTLIVINSKGSASGMTQLTAFTSAAVMIAILTISFAALSNGIREIKAGSGPELRPDGNERELSRRTKMDKILVAYFSASGVTAKVAERLAGAVGADLFEIRPEVLYTKTDLNWMDKGSRSSVEMNDRACRPAIAEKLGDMGSYTAVFVGFPIWWYREPSIIDTFMESYDFSGKTVIPFATSGGSGLGDSAENMQALAKGARVLEGRRFSAGTSGDELGAWAEKMLKGRQ